MLITSFQSKPADLQKDPIFGGGVRDNWLQNRGTLCSKAEELAALTGLSCSNQVLTQNHCAT